MFAAEIRLKLTLLVRVHVLLLRCARPARSLQILSSIDYTSTLLQISGICRTCPC